MSQSLLRVTLGVAAGLGAFGLGVAVAVQADAEYADTAAGPAKLRAPMGFEEQQMMGEQGSKAGSCGGSPADRTQYPGSKTPFPGGRGWTFVSWVAPGS